MAEGGKSEVKVEIFNGSAIDKTINVDSIPQLNLPYNYLEPPIWP